MQDKCQKLESLISDLETAIKEEDYASMKTLMEQGMETLKAGMGTPDPSNSSDGDAIETEFSSEK